MKGLHVPAELDDRLITLTPDTLTHQQRPGELLLAGSCDRLGQDLLLGLADLSKRCKGQ